MNKRYRNVQYYYYYYFSYFCARLCHTCLKQNFEILSYNKRNNNNNNSVHLYSAYSLNYALSALQFIATKYYILNKHFTLYTEISRAIVPLNSSKKY